MINNQLAFINNKDSTNFLKIICILMLLSDLTFTFLQFQSLPLDGDFAGGIFDEKMISKFIEDPFCKKCILQHEKRVNPNKAIAHLGFYFYYRNVPVLFQKIFTPIDSVYFSISTYKIVVQILFIYLICFIVSLQLKCKKSNRIFLALLVAPLFQTEGYNRFLGIIDQSPAYAFFYAGGFIFFMLSVILAILYNNSQSNRKSIFYFITLSVLGFVVNFYSPIVLGSSMSAIITFWIYCLFNRNKMNIKSSLIILSIFYFLLGIYSINISQYNIIDSNFNLELISRYQKIPKGLLLVFTTKIGWPLIFFSCLMNYYLLKSRKNINIKIDFTFFRYALIFILIYILSMPLGGYRDYRPFIIRYDTLIPFTTCVFLFYVFTSSLVLAKLKKFKILYFSYLAVISLIFINSDRLEIGRNDCEKQALQFISESSEDLIHLTTECTVWSWNKFNDPKYSIYESEAFQYYGITKNPKLYFW